MALKAAGLAGYVLPEIPLIKVVMNVERTTHVETAS